MTDSHDYDVVVVGSGFGGSVTALRLSEKGYRVGVLEAGRRFADDEFAKTSWNVRRFLWAPRLGCYGIQRIHVLKDVVVLAGAGVGGGSLVYANTLYEPPQAFYDDDHWRDITDWRAELAPHYATARRMLGVVQNPTITPSDEAMRAVAEEMGVGHTFRPTPVGVFFGAKPGETVDDPYFGGAGPRRTGCIECGSCMTGCRVGAKNTLPKNYLWLAEHAGAQVHPLTTVRAVRPLPDGGYAVETVRTGSWLPRRSGRTFTADQVVFAAGAYGTQRLLHRMRDDGVLPRLSPALGRLTRTNSEALLGAESRRRDVDFSRGVAITSSFYPKPDTHIEPVRYGHGSNLMGLLSTVLTDGGGRVPRWLKWLGQGLRHPLVFFHSLHVHRWSERSIIALVMQSVDNSLVVSGRRRLGRWGLTTRQGHGAPNPTWIPEGNDAVRRLAKHIDGHPGGSLGDLINAPMTAHFIGGCTIGASPQDGVIDPWHRVYGHDGLHVVDGSAVSANLGVNPSLTITAQAERAMSFWPRRGEPDPRPPLGTAYAPVPPVPVGAPSREAGHTR
ncbi:MAG TPA: GMC family oxidoreductase [Actinomycetes bacterium]